MPENTSYNTSRSTPPTDESSVNIHAHQSALPWHSLSKPIQSNTHVLPCMGTYFFFIYLFTHALCRVTRVSMYGYLFFFLFTHALCRVTRVSMPGCTARSAVARTASNLQKDATMRNYLSQNSVVSSPLVGARRSAAEARAGAQILKNPRCALQKTRVAARLARCDALRRVQRAVTRCGTSNAL